MTRSFGAGPGTWKKLPLKSTSKILQMLNHAVNHLSQVHCVSSIANSMTTALLFHVLWNGSAQSNPTLGCLALASMSLILNSPWLWPHSCVPDRTQCSNSFGDIAAAIGQSSWCNACRTLFLVPSCTCSGGDVSEKASMPWFWKRKNATGNWRRHVNNSEKGVLVYRNY